VCFDNPCHKGEERGRKGVRLHHRKNADEMAALKAAASVARLILKEREKEEPLGGAARHGLKRGERPRVQETSLLEEGRERIELPKSRSSDS